MLISERSCTQKLDIRSEEWVPKREMLLWAEPAQEHLGLSLVYDIVMELRFLQVGFLSGYLLVSFPHVCLRTFLNIDSQIKDMFCQFYLFHILYIKAGGRGLMEHRAFGLPSMGVNTTSMLSQCRSGYRKKSAKICLNFHYAQ